MEYNFKKVKTDALDADTTNKLPVYTDADIAAIENPEAGLIAFNSDDNAVNCYTGTAWEVTNLVLKSLTADQITSATGMVEGTIVYNSGTNKLNFWDGTNWVIVTSTNPA